MNEGQLFLEYIKTLPKIHGRIADMFLVFGETLNITYKHDAKMIRGDYPKVIKEKIIPASFRSFDNIEEMMLAIEVDFALSLIYSQTIVEECTVFNRFKFVCNAYQYTLQTIQYNRESDYDKDEINKAVQFIEQNTSITPVQDAFNALLLHYNLPINKLFINSCELPKMQEIDYSTVEELRAKREERHAKRKVRNTENFNKINEDLTDIIDRLENLL